MKRFLLVTICVFFVLSCHHVSADTIPTKTLEPVDSWTTEGTIEYLEFYPEILKGDLPQVRKIVYSDSSFKGMSNFHFVEYDIMGKEVLHFERKLTRLTISPKAKYFLGHDDKERKFDSFNDKEELLWSREFKKRFSDEIDIATYRTHVTDSGMVIESFKEYCPSQFLKDMGEYGPHFKLKILVYSKDKKNSKSFEFPQSFSWPIRHSISQLSDDQRYFLIDNVVLLSDEETSNQLIVLDLEKLVVSVKELCRLPKEKGKLPSRGYFFPEYYRTYNKKIYGIYHGLDERCKKNINLINVEESIKKNMTNASFFSVDMQDYFLAVNNNIEIISAVSNRRILYFKLPFSGSQEMTYGLNLGLIGKTLFCTTSWNEKKDNHIGNVYHVKFEDIVARDSYRVCRKYQLEYPDRIVSFQKTIVVDRFLIFCHITGYIIFDPGETKQ